MKPRNKLHHRIVDLSHYLFPISSQQKEWAYKECLEHRGYATKNRVLCLDCGDTFSPQLISRKKAVCPHCGTKLQIKESRKTTDRQVNYFAIIEIFNEFQIVRNFEIIANYKKGSSADIYIHEILQYWIQADLKVTMFGLKHNLNYCCDSWSGNMEIREEGSRYSYYRKKYDVYARKYHPDSVIKSEYKMYGIDTNLQQVTFLDAIKHIPHQPKLETLLKAKQYWLVDAHINQSGRSINYYWESIKICLRNKYKVKDAGLWMDYIDLLAYFNKDRKNAKYVCPKDLKKEHDRLVAKKRIIQKKLEIEEQKRIIQKKREIEEQKRRAEIDNEFFTKAKAKFFDLKFTNGPLVIIPLKSVQEFIEEGDKLKHCVFTNRYFDKEYSLILSARLENEPIETIEVDLKELKITQARGLKNNPTDHHDKILELVKKNLPKIAEIVKPKKRKKSKQLVKSN